MLKRQKISRDNTETHSSTTPEGSLSLSLYFCADASSRPAGHGVCLVWGHRHRLRRRKKIPSILQTHNNYVSDKCLRNCLLLHVSTNRKKQVALRLWWKRGTRRGFLAVANAVDMTDEAELPCVGLRVHVQPEPSDTHRISHCPPARPISGNTLLMVRFWLRSQDSLSLSQTHTHTHTHLSLIHI